MSDVYDQKAAALQKFTEAGADRLAGVTRHSSL
jgi:hypothetical protein